MNFSNVTNFAQELKREADSTVDVDYAFAAALVDNALDDDSMAEFEEAMSISKDIDVRMHMEHCLLSIQQYGLDKPMLGFTNSSGLNTALEHMSGVSYTDDMSNDQITQVTVEGLSDVASSIWEAIKKFFKKIWNFLTGGGDKKSASAKYKEKYDHYQKIIDNNLKKFEKKITDEKITELYVVNSGASSKTGVPKDKYYIVCDYSKEISFVGGSTYENCANKFKELVAKIPKDVEKIDTSIIEKITKEIETIVKDLKQNISTDKSTVGLNALPEKTQASAVLKLLQTGSKNLDEFKLDSAIKLVEDTSEDIVRKIDVFEKEASGPKAAKVKQALSKLKKGITQLTTTQEDTKKHMGKFARALVKSSIIQKKK
jgi:hypothetical protein